jgi:S1-C subfamily serine protease
MVDINYLQELAKAFVKKNVIENMVDVKEAIISLKVKMPSGNSESSGFIITPDGYAVTCAHCVNGEQGIQVRRRILDRRGNEVDVYYKAVLVAMDVPADVAVIKILELTGDNAYIPLLPRGEKDYDALDDIIMLGYPFGVSRFDNVSTNLGKIVSYQNRQDGPDFINIDLSAKSGNSGSGVLNLQAGYAIGVLCGGNLSHNGSLVEEVNYCRPISYVWDLIERNQEQKDENKGE